VVFQRLKAGAAQGLAMLTKDDWQSILTHLGLAAMTVILAFLRGRKS
jgi:hypothetical protein